MAYRVYASEIRPEMTIWSPAHMQWVRVDRIDHPGRLLHIVVVLVDGRTAIVPRSPHEMISRR